VRYPVVRRFRDKFTHITHRPGGTFTTSDPDRAEYLQKRGLIGPTKDVVKRRVAKAKKAAPPKVEAPIPPVAAEAPEADAPEALEDPVEAPEAPEEIPPAEAIELPEGIALRETPEVPEEGSEG